VLDEPVSVLNASMRAHPEPAARFQAEPGVSYLFTAHDLVAVGEGLL